MQTTENCLGDIDDKTPIVKAILSASLSKAGGGVPFTTQKDKEELNKRFKCSNCGGLSDYLKKCVVMGS